MISPEQLAWATRQASIDAGFDLAGVAPVHERDIPEVTAFAEWIDAGHAGEMKYMERRTEAGELKRASARHAAPWVRSVIVCAMNYNADKPYSIQVSDPRRSWISRYAWGGMDYHDALMPRLRRVEAAIRNLAAQQGMTIETRCYVDTGPLLERMYAKYAGIGWIGKNSCIINEKAGSWLFLGVILTSLEMHAGVPAADRCGSCTRCIDACPTQAIVAPGKLDARLCIAYLTIEKRGEIPEDLRAQVGHQVFGCDICQDVCPWNNKSGGAPRTSAPEFQPVENLFHPELNWLAQMDQETYQRKFRGSPVKRAKFAGLKRNVAVAMGNSGKKEFIPTLKKMAEEEDRSIREHAEWAIAKLER